jgi:diacylglycerol kinase family enzyme
VARSIGLGVDPARAISSLPTSTLCRVDLGRFAFPGESRREYFVEGFGIGVFAHIIGKKRQVARGKKTIHEAVEFIADELETYEPTRQRLIVDDCEVSGSYLLVAAMNMRSLGPTLNLAPRARWDDGELDVVFVRPESRETPRRQLRREVDQDGILLPEFDVIRARRVVFCGEGG